MREYEALFIVKPDLDEEATDAVIGRFEDLIKNGGGEILKTDKWGKRKLSYEIRGYREGVYVVLTFTGAPAVAQELERVFKITDEVIRYLITEKGK